MDDKIIQDIDTSENRLPEYLSQLNPQQRDAVVYTGGPSLVIAGAGSGKTRVLTYKIVHLLSHGFEPFRLMVLTFTNKAAREMKERISAVVGERIASRLHIGTFHSVFLRLLRANASLIGFNRNFTIYDASDSKALVKSIIKDLGLDEKVYKPATVASAISNAKNCLVSAAQYRKDQDNMLRDKRAQRPMTGRIYEVYAERCRVAQAMDFDDILFFMNVLLRDNPDVLRHYQEFFSYILVDEYQDTNFAQHLIISQLSKVSRNICVVGDDAQSIYSFRGANISNILNLEKQYDDLRIFKLERNYRSTQNIINAAGSLIEKNSRQIPKHVYSENSVGSPVRVISSYSDLEESTLVANSITESKLAHHDSYDDYAVLYRTNAQSRILEESLRKRNIPYRIYGGLSFYQRKEVKDAICYFRLALNPDDDEALRRVINYPARGIGETTLKKLTSAAIDNVVSLWDVVCDPLRYNLSVNGGTLKKLTAFADLVKLFVKDNADGANAFELAQLVFNRTGILTSLYNDNTPESVSRQENLAELLSGVRQFVELRMEAGEDEVAMSDFLNEVSLATDQESEDSDEPKVTIMTVHAAKGLEFSNIYIVGVEEELFPAAMSMDSLEAVEEERRLLYVAITRAKNYCTMSYAGSRYRNGKTAPTMPSRFLRDINHQYLSQVSSKGISSPFGAAWVDPRQNYLDSDRKYRDEVRSYTDFPDRFRTNSRRKDSSTLIKPGAGGRLYDISELVPGVRILHNRYGEGVIVSSEGDGQDAKINVDFDTVGVKRLLVRIAVFKIID